MNYSLARHGEWVRFLRILYLRTCIVHGDPHQAVDGPLQLTSDNGGLRYMRALLLLIYFTPTMCVRRSKTSLICIQSTTNCNYNYMPCHFVSCALVDRRNTCFWWGYYFCKWFAYIMLLMNGGRERGGRETKIYQHVCLSKTMNLDCVNYRRRI